MKKPRVSPGLSWPASAAPLDLIPRITVGHQLSPWLPSLSDTSRQSACQVPFHRTSLVDSLNTYILAHRLTLVKRSRKLFWEIFCLVSPCWQ